MVPVVDVVVSDDKDSRDDDDAVPFQCTKYASVLSASGHGLIRVPGTSQEAYVEGAWDAFFGNEY